MLFTVKALPMPQYQAWLALAQRAAGNGTNPEYTQYHGPVQGSAS
jgi:hypothetical protein